MRLLEGPSFNNKICSHLSDYSTTQKVETLYLDFELRYVHYILHKKEQDKEKVGNEIKAWRNEQLEKTDFTQQVDAPFTEEEKAKYREYRQALRNIPQQEGFPYDVVIPVLGE